MMEPLCDQTWWGSWCWCWGWWWWWHGHHHHHHYHRHPHHHQPQPQHQQQHYEQHHVISCYDHFWLSLSLCYQCYGLVIITNAITVAIITNLNLNTNTNCLIRFGDTKAPSSSFASWRSPWATKQIAKNPTNVDRTSNCYISGFKRAREVLKKGNSSKFNGQDDGHFILGPALKV